MIQLVEGADGLILNGDCLNVLKELPDNSVDSIVTDPPYHLIQKNYGFERGKDSPFKRTAKAGFMGKTWDGVDENGNGIAYNIELWKECFRVLKAGGHLLSFSGTRTYHRMAVAIEDAGFEIRDMIEWVYGSGFPKSLNIGKAVDKLLGNEREFVSEYQYPDGNKRIDHEQKDGTSFKSGGKAGTPITKGTSEWEGWGTSLKPAHESIMVATKPLNTLNHIDLLCRLIEYVRDVERSLKHKVVGLNEEKETIVQENVQIQQEVEKGNSMETGKVEDLNEVMDILQFSQQEVNTNLNTILLWKNILEEIYKEMNKSIISMENEMITELKILNYLIYQNIQNYIIKEESQVNGNQSNVLLVENLLKSLLLKLRTINSLSVQENVISKENNLNFAPNHEPICMARKPLAEKTVAENVLKYGTGGINIDESRVEAQGKDLDKLNSEWDREWNTNYSDYADKVGGSAGFNMDKAKKENAGLTGRFPANLIHDNSEEVRECFPESKSTPRTATVGGTGGVGVNTNFQRGSETSNFNDSGNASRFFKSIIYTAKASKSERNMGCEELEEKKTPYGSGGGAMPSGNDNPNKTTSRNNHPTVKPLKLMEYLIKMVTPKGGIVLDPFAGSGTTLVASKKNGFRYIGIELTEEYIQIINARLKGLGE